MKNENIRDREKSKNTVWSREKDTFSKSTHSQTAWPFVDKPNEWFVLDFVTIVFPYNFPYFLIWKCSFASKMYSFRYIVLLLCISILSTSLVVAQEDDSPEEINVESEKIEGFNEQENADVNLENESSEGSNDVLVNDTNPADTSTNSTTAKNKQIVNCVPVFRDESNKVSSIDQSHLHNLYTDIHTHTLISLA